MKGNTRKSARSGSIRTDKERATTRRKTSTPSGSRSNGSKGSWPLPKTVREFTSQANAVGTMLLNGDIDLDLARAYSAIARTIAQTIGADVARARAMKRVPDLGFDEYGE